MTRKRTPLQQLEREYAAITRARAVLTAKAQQLAARTAALRTAAALVCTHPTAYRAEFTWEHDNGYGRQSRVTGERCNLCGQQKRWKSMSSWQAAE